MTHAYAGLVTRTVAFAIDAALINLAGLATGVVFTLVFSLLPVSDDFQTVLVAIGAALFVVWGVVYFVTFWTTTGETPGNRVMRIRVESDREGHPLNVGRALLRVVGIAVSVPLFVGFWPILFTDRRRGLHDMLAGTVVLAVPVAADAPSRSVMRGGRERHDRAERVTVGGARDARIHDHLQDVT